MTAELGIFNGHLLQHLLAALWFLFCWVGYTRYATWKGRDTACLPASCTSTGRTGCAGCCCATTVSPTPA